MVTNGIFIESGGEGKELHFKEDGFTFLDKFGVKDFSYYNCCDTLSYGTFQKVNGSFLEVSSNEFFNTGYLDFNIKENVTNSRDTLYIKITNPIEDKYNIKTKRELIYSFQLGSNNKELNKYFMYTIFNQNTIKIPIPNTIEIYDIELKIYVEPYISIKEKNIDMINTTYKKLKNNQSNEIEINIPNLTYSYINFRRLKKDYIRIASEKKIIWDGVEYLKK